MYRLAEKSQEIPIRPAEKPEAVVVENPILIPIAIVYAVLPNIVCGIFVPVILRRQCIQIVKRERNWVSERRPAQFRVDSMSAIHDLLRLWAPIEASG